MLARQEFKVGRFMKRGKVRRVASWELAPSDEEYESLLDSVGDNKDRLIILVLGKGGFRRKEFVSIRNEWFVDGKVRVPMADPRIGFKAKTPASARTVDLRSTNRYAWDVLRDWIDEHNGVGFSVSTVNYRVARMGKRVLERRLIPHAFRSYCAMKLAVRWKGDIFAMMNYMGWDTPTVAMRYVRAAGIHAERAEDEARMRGVEAL